MGYTHYFEQKADTSIEIFREITSVFAVVLDEIAADSRCDKVVLVPEHGDDGDSWICKGRLERLRIAVLPDQAISFNGLPGCETMVLERVMTPPPWRPERRWDFCKTNRQPYDVAVCALLLIVETLDEGNWEIGSDGLTSDSGWDLAADLVVQAWGDVTIPVAVSPPSAT